MTDKEIIKALECCTNNEDCLNCPLQDDYANCNPIGAALDLINRQQAEIERLQSVLLRFMDEVAKWEEKYGLDVSELPLIPICDEGRDIIDHYRKRAIEQFAERLKERQQTFIGDEYAYKFIYLIEIDNLVKEMVGDAE